MSVTIWKNVAVAMQSAAAATKTITAITKANPGVVSSTAHGYLVGDYILLSTQGMFQMDNRVVRASAVVTDSWTLEGIDTTLFDTFTSGTSSKLTMGTSITTATTMNASGGDFDFIDTTTIHDNVKTQIPGLSNPITYTFDNQWDSANAGQIAMKQFSDAQAPAAFRFTFGTGGKIMVFYGYVGFAGAPGGSAQQMVTSQATITQFGRPSYYAS